MSRPSLERLAELRAYYEGALGPSDALELFAEFDALTQERDKAEAAGAALHLALAQIAATIRAAGQERECQSALAIADRALAQD